MPKSRSTLVPWTRRRWTEADARAALEAQTSSGEPVSVFAQREGLDPQRLYRWRRRLGSGTDEAIATTTFLEIRPQVAPPVEVVLRSGRVLRVAQSIDDVALLRLVELLEREGPC